jgi:hypothetical protein
MQTRVFVQALDDIIQTLRLEELAAILNETFEGNQRPIEPAKKHRYADILFAIDSGFARILADPVLREVAEGLNLQDLLGRASRTMLMTDFQNAETTHTITTNKRFVKIWLSTQILLRLSQTVHKLLLEPEDVLSQPGTASIELEIADYDNSGVPAQRVVVALTALLALYTTVEGQKGQGRITPVLKWVDSGSNISFSFQGLAEVIAEVRQIFASTWKAVRFAKNERIERDLSTALKQVAFLRDLEAVQQAGGIKGETAARIRHQVTESMVTLLGAGVMPIELEGHTTYDRAEVLEAVRDTKLLGSGEPPTPPLSPSDGGTNPDA